MDRTIAAKYHALQADFEKRINTGKLGNLSLSDFHEVGFLGTKLLKEHAAKTVVKNAADYYKSFGFSVEAEGIGFLIKEA